ncbi:gamma-interferon-responsive lysosomal thiol protein-like [Phragmites australis]|uniref:gamma-interferon-responsive lysosomal thiol protein-like n=1 Tax=Phragmites australis TaxID=29695 RepID=UPI002D796FFD|nr:gamma-interferon-responsive lysosomal thiol protein-like [Phragmites australis]
MAGSGGLLLALVLLYSAAASPASGAKVSLALYYESLCPYCSRFIVNHLAGIFDDGLIDVVDLRLVPYGNAHVGSNNEISCQHGSGRGSVAQSRPHSVRAFIINLLSRKGSASLCNRG